HLDHPRTGKRSQRTRARDCPAKTALTIRSSAASAEALQHPTCWRVSRTPSTTSVPLATPNPPSSSPTSATHSFSQHSPPLSSATSLFDVADKNDKKPSDINDVADVADKNRGEARKDDNEQDKHAYIEELGAAPAGSRCTLCGGGGPVRIRHG